MESFDYLIGIVSILIGLGLAEVASGTNRLLRSASARHDPLVFGPPILIALMLVSVWFDVWAVRQIASLFSFPFFVLIFAQLMLLYLLAASCVPKAASESAPLTAEDYEHNRGYFWRLFSVYQLLYVGLWLFLQTQKGVSPPDLIARILTPRGAALPLVIGLALAMTRNRIAHGLGLILLIVWLFLGYWNYRIA